MAKSKLPTPGDTFTLVGFRKPALARIMPRLVMGDITNGEPVLGRIPFQSV